MGAWRTWRDGADARRARWRLLRMVPSISAGSAVLVSAMVLAGAGLQVAAIFASGAVVGRVPAAVEGGLSSSAGRALLTALVAVVVVFLASQVIGPVQNVVVATLGRRVNAHLRSRVMDACAAPTGIAHLEDPDVLDRVRDAQGIAEGQFTPGDAVGAYAGAMQARLSSLAAGAIVARFSVPLAVALVAFGLMTRIRLVDDFVRTAGKSIQQTEGMRRADYLRTLALGPAVAKETRVFGMGGWLLDRFRAQWSEAMGEIWRQRREQDASPWLWSLPWGVLLAGALTIVGRAAVDGRIGIGEVAVLTGAVMGAGSVWISGWDIQLAFGAASLPAVLDLEELLRSPALAATGAAEPSTMPRRDVRFEAVAFRYPGREDDVFAGLDLTIEAGRSLAIVGANGAGKTTLVKLLARLYEPTAGRITVDGAALTELEPRAWQRRVAAIFQDFTRFELSAADNVGFGALECRGDLEALERAAERAGLSQVMAGLPAGWDTVLSRQFSGGSDLSGGQWQRIALARALLAVDAGAGILVLDEPTANLDVRAEAELFDRFLELTRGVTTVLISHRFSTVRHADRIVVLDGGRVVEDGSHEALVAAGGRYARLFRLQAARFVDAAPVLDLLELGADEAEEPDSDPSSSVVGSVDG